ncbi:E3 ubiquitin-protein ligase RNF123-like [Acropora millepora]|uniref:E3 ubiquitin-protein ligase RNF123-like n=1 Tax=Acropora millepora TaxID=45264 RepID=UPI001CF1550D|nr:E3 ubiquitin-protein ligase RNF123-like [Acropora millepora]
MDVNQFLTAVFPSKSDENIATPRRMLEYGTLQDHIAEILSQYNEDPKPELDEEGRALTDGRIGPFVVYIDRASLCGSMTMKEGNEIESKSNFSSVRASTCVCKGKWMYEILLGSKGIMQLGWATLQCKFTNEEGVGDTPDSFAYDGHRVRKWNVMTGKYGEEWMAGDVIGCCIDLDEGTISYSRNGLYLGVAFDNVQFGPGQAYFPAASLSYGESCQMNFGAAPFKFPIDGYKPLQDPPVSDLAKASELVACLERLLPAPDRIPCLPPSLHGRSDALTLLTTAHVFEKLGPLLTSGYLGEEVLLPFLLRSCSSSSPLEHQPGVHKVLDLMWVCMEDFELEPCLSHLLNSLVKCYWFQPVSMDFTSQVHCLTLALAILKHERTRRMWITCKTFPQKFSYFMHIKPPDDNILQCSFPRVWWESEDETSKPSEESKTEYMAACNMLRNKVQVLENIQVEICKILLKGDDRPTQNAKPTRVLFLEKFRKFLQENMMIITLQPSSACAGPVITCFYHRLVQALRWHWEQWAHEKDSPIKSKDAYVPNHVFFDDSINYWDLSRLGGVLSHLKKAYSEAISESANREESGEASDPSMANEDRNLDLSLVEMLDDVIMLYHIAVHKQLSKVRAVRDNMKQNVKALEETMAKIRRCSPERTDVLTELERSKRVFLQESTNCARHMAWVSILIFTEEKQNDVHWMLKCIISSAQRGAAKGPLFEFTPEFYMDAAINAFHGLRHYFHPTSNFSDIPDASSTLSKMAAFLCTHFVDQRIINPDLRDVIIQSLAAFVCYPDSLEAVEQMPETSLEKTVRSLMAAYDKRSWVQTTWILVRVWKGCGFAFRYTSSPDALTLGLPEQGHLRASLQPPHPSTKCQQLFGQLCIKDNKLANEFLNGLLNQLNWSFSEFIGMLQEIQQVTHGVEATTDPRHLRTCAVCFDLTVGLMRVLEMVASVAPEVFTDWKRPSAELHIARLFQLLTQVLNRVTASSNLFENVTRLHLPGLETVDRFPILGAVTGILLTLLMEGTSESKERATSSLLAEPGYSLATVSFLVGGKESVAESSTSKFSFQKLVNKDVTTEEVQRVDVLVKYLEEQDSQAQLQKQESVDVDELCPICYATKMSVRFLPCLHASCRSCISRHLMNHKECFFCKTVVDELENFNTESGAKKSEKDPRS